MDLESETDLLKKIASGDKPAFTTFYKLYNQKIYRIAYGYFPNPFDAEELMQDVLVELYRSAGKFNHKSSLSTWIYKITVNKCLDKLRFLNAKKRFFILSFLSDKENETRINELPDNSHIEQEDRNEKMQILLSAMSKLPQPQKTALILTQIEELSGKEASEIMQISVKALESLIQRGKANLRKIIENTYYKTKDN